MYDLNELRTNPASRRGFLAAMTAAGLGVVASQVLDGKSAIAAAPDRETEALKTATFPGIPGANINIVVLNYALSAEYLESDLYRQALNAATGLALTTPLSSDPTSYGRNIAAGGLSSANANAAYEYLKQFAYIEAAHRDFLITTLQAAGVTPVAPKTYAFPGGPGTTMKAIATNILALEENGVRAYLGAVNSITLVGTYGQAAATIFSTEARHSAAMAYVLKRDIGPVRLGDEEQVVAKYPSSNTFEYYRTPAQVLAIAANYIVSS